MNTDLMGAEQRLARGRLFKIPEGQGKRVECLAGCLWLTQERDLRDVVLEAGQGFTVDRPGDTFLSALADSSFVVLDSAPAVVSRGRTHASLNAH